MSSPEVLALQVVRRTLDDLKVREVDRELLKDRLDRIDGLLSRVVAGLDRRIAADERFAADRAHLLGSAVDDPARVHERTEAAVREIDAGGAIDRLGRIVALEKDVIGRWEAEVAALDPRRQSDDEDQGDADLAETLDAYLRARLPDQPDIRVTAARRLPGGRSKHTLLAEVSGSTTVPARIVLREDSSRTVEIESVVHEYPLIDFVYRSGCPAPEPLWLERDRSVLGAPFIAFVHMPGAPAGNLWGAHEGTGDAAREMAAGLAKVHLLPGDQAPGPHYGSAREATKALFESYRARWRASKPGPSVSMEAAFAWLGRRIDVLDGPAKVIHGDAHFSNMLVDQGRLVCLLDWEFWHLGHPAEDIAYCRPYIEQVMDWGEFLALYEAAGGTPPSDEQLALFSVWRPLRNTVLAANVAHDFRKGNDFDLESAAIALGTYPRMEAQVAAALDKALNG